MNKRTMGIVIVIVLILLFVIFKFLPKSNNKTTDSKGKWVECTSKASDLPTKYKDWNSKLYAAKLEDKSSNVDATKTDTRDFEINKLVSKKDTDSIYHRVQRDVFPSNYVTGVKTVMEVCNENNQTPLWNSTKWEDKISASGEKISARIDHLHNSPQSLMAGKYRIDGYFFIDGAWHLGDRIENVTLKD